MTDELERERRVTLSAIGVDSEPSCPHVETEFSQGLVFVVGLRKVICPACFNPLHELVVEANQRPGCDICGEPSEGYVGFGVALGKFLYLGSAGDCCAYLFEGATQTNPFN